MKRQPLCPIGRFYGGWIFSLVLWILLQCGFAGALRAESVVVSASVDRQTLSLEDTLTLTVRVRGSTDFFPPEIPGRGNFQILDRSTSSQIQILNQQILKTIQYTYLLQPLKIGKHSIGPIRVAAGGQVFEASPILVTVTGAGSVPPQNPSTVLPQNPQNPPQNKNPSDADKDVFVTAEVDRSEVYAGEYLVYTFKLFTAVNIAGGRYEFPKFKGFAAEDFKGERRYEVVQGGRKYLVSEFQSLLFPIEKGSLTLEPTVFSGQVEEAADLGSLFDDPFFGPALRPRTAKTRVLKTRPLTVLVKPLPEPAPADFKGAVGNFAIAAKLSATAIQVGETANLQVTVTGTGNFSNVVLSHDFQAQGLKAYEEKPVVEVKKTAEGQRGTKTFGWAFVPQQNGAYLIAPLSFSYFDPKNKRYITLTTPPFELKATGGAEPPVLAKPQTPDSLVLENSSFKNRFEKTTVILKAFLMTHFKAIALLIAAALGLFFLVRWIKSRKTLSPEKQSQKLFRKATRKLSRLKSTSPDFAEQFSAILNAYLGQKMGLKAEALTAKDLDFMPMEEALRLRWKALFTRLDAFRYGQQDWSSAAGELILEGVELLKKTEAVIV